MNDQPLVSIVIPVWNHARELARSLESLKRQSYPSLEGIIVDDGSTDNPRAVVEAAQTPFPVHFTRFEANRGAAAARNEGAKTASGTYLLFVDADAVLVPHAIQLMVETLRAHPDASFVYSSFRFGWKRFPSRPFDAEALRRGPYIHTTSLLRRNAFSGFDESLKKLQDWDLWLTIVERGGVGVWIPEELFRLSVGRKGMSRWLPSFFHRLPWEWVGWMPTELKNYRHWERVVKEKYGIA